MKYIQLLILVAIAANLNFAAASEKKSNCSIMAQDPFIQAFYRDHGFEVDSDKGNFEVEFEVTCEAVDKQKAKFSSTEIHKTTTKIEIHNIFEDKKVLHYTNEVSTEKGRMESTIVVPCLDTKKSKQKLLEQSLEEFKGIFCDNNDQV